MFLLNPFYIYIFILLLGDTEEKTRKQTKISFTAQNILRVHSFISMVQDDQS
jgi:hypothetical protein